MKETQTLVVDLDYLGDEADQTFVMTQVWELLKSWKVKVNNISIKSQDGSEVEL